jgi:hypothetical protein
MDSIEVLEINSQSEIESFSVEYKMKDEIYRIYYKKNYTAVLDISIEDLIQLTLKNPKYFSFNNYKTGKRFLPCDHSTGVSDFEFRVFKAAYVFTKYEKHSNK